MHVFCSAKQNSELHVSEPHVHSVGLRVVPSLFSHGSVHVHVDVSAIQYIPFMMLHVVSPHLHVATSFSTVPSEFEHRVVITSLHS